MAQADQEVTRTRLKEALTGTINKEAVVSECVTLVDNEVASKRGVTSVPLKAAYRLVKGIRPGFVKMVVEHLLPEFADALDPLWSEALSSSEPVEHFENRSSQAAEALLSVTDARIDEASAPVRGAYKKLRGTAKKHVESAVPGLARIIARHASYEP